MVAVLVLHTLQHMALQLLHNLHLITITVSLTTTKFIVIKIMINITSSYQLHDNLTILLNSSNSNNNKKPPPPSKDLYCALPRVRGIIIHYTWLTKCKHVHTSTKPAAQSGLITLTLEEKVCQTVSNNGSKRTRVLFVGCLTSQQHASVSQGRICSDNFMCCHTEIEVADQTFYLTRSHHTDTRPTSPSTDPIIPGTWQGSHWSANC